MKKKVIKMDVVDWLEYGYANGWCSPPVCFIHDGFPTSIFEDAEMEESDPCLHMVRLYDDEQHKNEVEANHPPSQWRALNQGWDIK